MVFTENAKIISAEELKEMINDEECAHPAIDRLFFVEVKNEDKKEKIFPCFIEGYMEDEGEKKENGEAFVMFIANIPMVKNGEFHFLKVLLHEGELGVLKRIWDKPPASGLRNDYPFLEEGVQ